MRKGDGEQVVKVKLEPRLPALQLLARHHRLVEEQPIVSVQQDVPIDEIELARRVAFMLYRANAQTLESAAPVASREALIEQRLPESEPPN